MERNTQRKARILIACEESGTIRRAFENRWGSLVEVMSADLQPARDGAANHFQGDVFELLTNKSFDLVIAHPPCTHLAVSGAKHFAKKRADGRQQQGNKTSKSRSKTFQGMADAIADQWGKVVLDWVEEQSRAAA